MPQDDRVAQASVFDLPQLHTKPSFTSLMKTLSSLAAEPASWDISVSEAAVFNEDGLPAYLTRLISSPLAWLASDAEREGIWELASKRLSERSGRSAMSSFERVFAIPLTSGARDESQTVNIRIYEPALTGDQIGHKTWLGAYVLAKLLHTLLPKHFLPVLSLTQPANQLLQILELGAGTGLAGLAAAILFPTTCQVHLTDLPEILANLRANLERNTYLLPQRNVSAEVLDWSNLPVPPKTSEKYDCILAADSLYGPEHPKLLTNAIATFLKRNEQSRVFTVLPFREMDRDYHADLRMEMVDKGFEIQEGGTELGVEDWYTWKGREEVLCWWCVWRWKEIHRGDWDGLTVDGVVGFENQPEIFEDGSFREDIHKEKFERNFAG